MAVNAGIAFAIPSNQANNLVQQILEFGEVRRGLLGIKGGELNADLAKAFNVSAQQGAFVSEVIPNSAAEKAGLKAGDVITAMNGQKISASLKCVRKSQLLVRVKKLYSLIYVMVNLKT